MQMQHKRVIHVAPDNRSIEEFARAVCNALEKDGETRFSSNDVMWGLAGFLKLIAELTIKQMNAAQSELVDTQDLQE